MSTVAGLDLHLDLSPTRPARSLEEALRTAVRDGRLAPQTRLPAARTLATDLGISRNTVAAVYGQLVAEGWLEARVGAGTWVSEKTPADTIHRAGSAGRRRALAGPRIDMRGGIPDTTGFPRREWVAAVRAATLGAAGADFGYPDPAGTPRLRTALAGYLARTRGVAARPDGVLVGQGFGELLVLVCRALRARGSRQIAVEEYGHAEHRRLIAATGLRLVPVPVDGDGADVAAIENTGVGAVLLTPSHQFPVGVPLAAQRRRRLVAWAERTGGLILEDDYDGEFRYDRRTIGALQALAPRRVVYLGTASKAVAPSVGLAWAVPPEWLLPAVLEERALAGGKPAALQQLALATFIETHEYDRSVRRLRAVYRARRTRLEEVVAQRLPGCEVTGLAAGLQCLLRLPPDADEARIEDEASDRGLRLAGLGSFHAPGTSLASFHATDATDTTDATGTTHPTPGARTDPALVIGYGGPTPGQFETALTLIVESITAASRR